VGNTNGEKVAAIRQAWREFMPEGSDPTVDPDLYAQIAINVLTDWHKRQHTPPLPQPVTEACCASLADYELRLHQYHEHGLCKRCGRRPHMRVFTVCKHCRYDKA
jgi:hypothetical protein